MPVMPRRVPAGICVLCRGTVGVGGVVDGGEQPRLAVMCLLHIGQDAQHNSQTC